jgi:hypothetical protein
MRRRDEPEPSIGGVRMDAEILVADPLPTLVARRTSPWRSIRPGFGTEEMRFDITGSSLVMDDFQVIGKVGPARAHDWHARMQLEQT